MTAPYFPEPAIVALGDTFYDAVAPADFPQTILRYRNDRAAAEIGLDGLTHEDWLRHFGRFEPLPENLPQPLALRYHGHQFRHYNPDIGDGRGFLFAQLRDQDGRLMDLGTKGSGQTPYSRFGDGRLTLKGGVREILATEMLEALGIETSRTFSLIETGEHLLRGDEPSPTRSAVLVRLSHGHIRIGTFQRLAHLGHKDGLRALTAYCLRYYFGEDGGDAVRLLEHVAGRTATLAASYIVAGFVHGVLNSDNINITGESFDYGPWRFTPFWDADFTAAYFDHAGLYAFGRQPEAIQWDLAQLAIALSDLAPVEPLGAVVEGFADGFRAALAQGMCRRLGVRPRGREDDAALLARWQAALGEQSVTIDRAFFDWRGGRRRARLPAEAAHESPAFAALAAVLAEYEPIPGAADHAYWLDAEPCSMHIEEVEAIWAAIAAQDDWSLLHRKVASIRRMGEALNTPA